MICSGSAVAAVGRSSLLLLADDNEVCWPTWVLLLLLLRTDWVTTANGCGVWSGWISLGSTVAAVVSRSCLLLPAHVGHGMGWLIRVP